MLTMNEKRVFEILVVVHQKSYPWQEKDVVH
jgi:hypothetical protein